MTTSYEERFNDPAFVEIWNRWQKARHAWGKAWETLDFAHGGSNSRYDPEPLKIPNLEQRAVAQEFIDARAAYKAELDKIANSEIKGPHGEATKV